MERVTLHTDRLTLRAPRTADVDAITAACQDPEIPRWTTVPSPYTRAHGEDFVKRVAEWWESGEEAIWGLFRDDVLVGMIGLHNIAPHATGASAEIGFWATSDSRGQGFMVEAARTVIDWGFAELELARIAWRAVAGNVPSARTARALDSATRVCGGRRSQAHAAATTAGSPGFSLQMIAHLLSGAFS